jgi:hypothetical protein
VHDRPGRVPRADHSGRTAPRLRVSVILSGRGLTITEDEQARRQPQDKVGSQTWSAPPPTALGSAARRRVRRTGTPTAAPKVPVRKLWALPRKTQLAMRWPADRVTTRQARKYFAHNGPASVIGPEPGLGSIASLRKPVGPLDLTTRRRVLKACRRYRLRHHGRGLLT